MGGVFNWGNNLFNVSIFYLKFHAIGFGLVLLEFSFKNLLAITQLIAHSAVKNDLVDDSFKPVATVIYLPLKLVP